MASIEMSACVENIEDLVAKSDELAASAEMFSSAASKKKGGGVSLFSSKQQKTKKTKTGTAVRPQRICPAVVLYIS